MARFNVTVNTYENPNRPHLKYVVNCYHPTKGRQRFFKATKEEASSKASELQIEVENFGLNALNLSAGQRIEALDAFERIKPFGLSLTEVVRDFVERKQSSTLTTAEVVVMYLKSRERLGRSVRHLSGLRNVLGRFNETFGPKRMGDVTSDHIQDWLYAQNVAPLTSNHHRSMLHSVFQFALMRKIVRENPTKAIELQVVKAGKVGILTPDQMRALLKAAGDDTEVLVTIAIGGFAGLRPEELARLKWSAIDLDHGQIDCGSEITKTAKHRYVKIEPVLSQLLDIPYKQAREVPSKLIQGPNFRRRFDDIRHAAGFAVRGSDGIPWPHDCMRHSFASYHLAKFKNAGETALQLGHEGTSMLFKNYRARVSEKDADAWWQITKGT